MFQPLSIAIGLRYTRAKRRNHFISFISLTSMLGITLGVWALITVLSIMNGFEGELRDRILGVASHVTVSGPDGWLDDWPKTATQVTQHPEVQAAAPYILGPGMLTRGSQVSGALIRGIEPESEAQVSKLAENLVAGQWRDLQPGTFRIILGQALADQLGVRLGDKVTLIAPKGQVTPAGLLPRVKRFTVSGLFKMGMYEYDSGLALIHIEDAQRLYRSEGRVSGIRLRIDDVYRAPWVRVALQDQFNESYRLSDWTIQHRNFFRALQIEKRVMFIILFLIIAVAAFNIISTLVMVVTDKQADIAILRTLGMTPNSVMGVFIVQGMVIGVIGTLLGGITGVITAINVETLVPYLENLFGVKFFPPDVYVISDFPAEMHWDDVFRITGMSLVISALATLYPARRAAKTQPAEALRYE